MDFGNISIPLAKVFKNDYKKFELRRFYTYDYKNE
jgi:hypothetical protein